MEDAFRWHPAATIVDRDGRAHGPEGAGARSGGLTDPDDPVAALRAALGHPGAAFRIGGAGPLPDPGPHPVFETLTSGSAGAPRRIRRSHASWCASFAVNARTFGIGPGVRVGSLGDLAQSLALYAVLEGLHLGAEVHLLHGLRADRQAAAVADRRIDVLYATPVQLRLLVAGAVPGTSVRLVLAGGAKLDPPLRAGLMRAFPAATLREFYGAAETSFVTLTGPGCDPASVGQPYPGVRIAVRNGRGDPVADGETGEVWVQSPYLFEGYTGAQPVAGAARWDDGWLSVGEIGRMEGSRLHLSGRAGRMVGVGDRAVFPEEVEAFLMTLPGVIACAVVPRADDVRGHVLDAVMMGDPVEEAAILRAARAHLGPLIAPRRIVWRADWPVLPSGKTDLAALMAAS